MTALTTIIWLWFIMTVVSALIWLSRHGQIATVRRLAPPLNSRMYAGEAGTLPRLSLLVAAKDEEANIRTCLRSLLAQDYPDYEVIAINDRSADRTGAIMDELAVQDPRLRALHVHELRPGWFGKNNAMREGVEQAGGEWLCFTDADCVFETPRVLAIAARFAAERGADFVSILPSHEANSFWERVIQPACSGILLIWFHPLRVNDPNRRTAYANGAFMLMRRSCYDAVGGHEAVKAEVNEDIHFAEIAKRIGQRLCVVTNEDLYSVRMYSTLAGMWSGWTRIFYGCFRTMRRLLMSLLVVTMMSLLPWLALAGGLLAARLTSGGSTVWSWLAWAGAAAAVAQLSVTWRFYALSRLPPWYGLLYPIGAVVGFGALVNAMRRVGGRRSITWRGTSYQGSRVTSGGTPPPGDARS